jgi:hypothetical protein
VFFLYSKCNLTYFLTVQLFLLPSVQLPSCFPTSLCSLYPNTFCAACPITFCTAYTIAFCAAYSIALCSDAFPYAILSSLPFSFLRSLLKGSLCAFPCAFLSSLPFSFLCSLLIGSVVVPSFMHFYAAYSIALCVPSLMHFYASYPSSFCAAYSMERCAIVPSLLHLNAAYSSSSLVLGLSIGVLPFYCPSISPSPVRPYPVNLLRHPRLGLGYSWSVPRPSPDCCLPLIPPTRAPRRTLENSLWLYCSPAEQPVMYTTISNLLTIFNVLPISLLCTTAKLFGINIYVLCLLCLCSLFSIGS